MQENLFGSPLNQSIKNIMIQSKLLFSISFMVFTGILQIANAQTPSWKWVNWSDGTQTTARSVCADLSGNLYAAGTFNTSTKFDTGTLTSNGTAGFVVKYSEKGICLWKKGIKNPGFAAVDCKSIAIDGVGNVYITGSFSGTIELDSKTLTGGGDYVAKYNNNGAIQWAVKSNASNGLAVNANGIFLAGGNSIQKFDASGGELWTITGVKSNQGYTNFFSVALNKAGKLIVAGDIDDKWTFGTTLITGGYQNIILMEISDAGTVGWNRVLGSNTNGADHAQHITIDAADNIIMTGAVGGITMFDAVSISSKNGYLLKLNSKGVAKWGTTITNINTIYGTGGISVTSDEAGAMYVTGGYGNTDVTDGASTVFTKGIKAGGNAFILKFDSTGVFNTALVNFENPTINNSRGMAMASSSAGVYFAGVCSPSSEWGTLKVSGYGSVFAKIDGNAPSSGMSTLKLNEDILVYPNPSNGKFNLNFMNEVSQISIKNLVGETIYQVVSTGTFITIDLELYPKGIYFLELMTSRGIITKKLVME